MTAKLRITGREAADIASHARHVVRTHFWTEIQGMRECNHGCKLHARKRGAVMQYALIHYSGYGCQLGRDEATAYVSVSIAPKTEV